MSDRLFKNPSASTLLLQNKPNKCMDHATYGKKDYILQEKLGITLYRYISITAAYMFFLKCFFKYYKLVQKTWIYILAFIVLYGGNNLQSLLRWYKYFVGQNSGIVYAILSYN